MQFLKVFCVAKNQMSLYICAVQFKYIRGGDNCKSTISRLLRKWMSKSKKVTTKHNTLIYKAAKLQIFKTYLYRASKNCKYVDHSVRFTLFSCLRTRLRNFSRTKDYQKENMNSNRLINFNAKTLSFSAEYSLPRI